MSLTDIIQYIGTAELLAILTAITFAAAQVCIRLGMESGSPLMAALITNAWVSAGGLALSLYRGTLQTSSWQAIFWYAMVGLAGPGVGRITYLIGIDRMGLSRSLTITSCSPFWSTLIAVILLGEHPSAMVVFGTLAIVAGVALLCIQENGTQSFRSWLQGALIFPLVASLGYAFPPIFAKMAYAHQSTPAVGMAVAFFSANVVLLAAKPFFPILGNFQIDRKNLNMLHMAGIFNVISSFCLWTALALGSVSTTVPLSRTAPIFALILGYLFLGKQEIITRRILIGALSVVLGGVLITAFR